MKRRKAKHAKRTGNRTHEGGEAAEFPEKIAGTATVSRLFFVSLPHVTNGGTKMADDYLGRKMEEYMARKASGQSNRRPLATLGRLLLKTAATAVTTPGSSYARISSGA